MKCPHCSEGKLEVKEAILIGSFEIVCDSCGATWVDEDDVRNDEEPIQDTYTSQFFDKFNWVKK